MPEIDQKRPAGAENELKKMQQRLVDETVDESFPASDPPAWTTTGSKSVAARTDEGGGSAGSSGGEQGGAMEQASRLAGEAYETGRRYIDQAQERFPEAGRYVRRGREAVARPVESYPLTAVMLAGAVGFGLAWFIYGTGGSRGQRQVPAYGKRPRYGWRPGAMDSSERRHDDAHLAAAGRQGTAAGAAPDSF